MALQPVQSLSELAAAPVFNAANASDTFAVAPASDYAIHVKNTNAAACTVTIDDVASLSPAQATQFNPDISFVVPLTNGERIIKINSTRFRTSGGVITITFSVTAGVTYAIYGPL